jgi:hypothetical protein
MNPPYLQEESEKQAARLRAILSRITYKPGWILSVRRTELAVVLCAEWTVEDVATGRPIQLVREQRISAYELTRWTEVQLVKHFIYAFLHEAETHELREWYKYEGEHVVEPHPERAAKSSGIMELGGQKANEAKI